MSKPNLFIVGAPKCGTTFLYDLLEGREEFFLPSIKELNYFSYKELVKDSYYRDYKVGDKSKYLAHYRKASANSKYLIDASVSYFVSEDAPRKIKELSPAARIIIMLRDPVKRAYSHYLMDKRMGYANQNFESYLNNIRAYQYLQYVGNSNFSVHVNRYISMFGPDNVLLLLLEERDNIPDKLSSFLQVDIAVSAEQLATTVNAKKSAKNPIGQFALKNRHVVERVKKYVPTNLKETVLQYIYGEAKDEPITESQQDLLRKLLKDDIEFFNSLREC